jgi:ribonuclease P protein component
MGGLATLKTRADFLRIAAARSRAVMPGLILQAAVRPDGTGSDEQIRVGFTASRKVGNAVVRNRAKRRLRAAAAAVLPRLGRLGTDYVLIARAAAEERSYPALVADLESALRRLAAPQREDSRGRRGRCKTMAGNGRSVEHRQC